MSWIEESRRSAFECGAVRRAKRSANEPERPKDLNRALSEDVRLRAIAIGNELILPYEDALAAIGIANEHEIAVLGFDSGEVLGGGFQILDYTGYDANIPFIGDWITYVKDMNVAAKRWIEGHRLGKNQGYIITSVSQKEFKDNQRKIRQK
jgi:hypothetical protein